MDKIIKVSKDTHKTLKKGAACAGKSMKEFIDWVSIHHTEGVYFDVEAHDMDILIAVYADISEYLFEEQLIKILSEGQKSEILMHAKNTSLMFG